MDTYQPLASTDAAFEAEATEQSVTRSDGSLCAPYTPGSAGEYEARRWFGLGYEAARREAAALAAAEEYARTTYRAPGKEEPGGS